MTTENNSELLINVHKKLRTVFKILGDDFFLNKNQYIVSGGYVVKLIDQVNRNISIDYGIQDIDVFLMHDVIFKNSKFYKALKKGTETSLYEYVQENYTKNHKGYLFNFIVSNDYSKTDFGKKVLGDFDLIHCSVGMTVDKILYDAQALDCIANKTMLINSRKNVKIDAKKTFSRILKYYKRGFEIPIEDQHKVFSKLYNSDYKTCNDDLCNYDDILSLKIKDIDIDTDHPETQVLTPDEKIFKFIEL